MTNNDTTTSAVPTVLELYYSKYGRSWKIKVDLINIGDDIYSVLGYKFIVEYTESGRDYIGWKTFSRSDDVYVSIGDAVEMALDCITNEQTELIKKRYVESLYQDANTNIRDLSIVPEALRSDLV